MGTMHALDEHFAVELILACITRGGEFHRSSKDLCAKLAPASVVLSKEILADRRAESERDVNAARPISFP